MLTHLDSKFGDGDHGDAMIAGFSAVSRAVRSADAEGLSPAQLLVEAADALAEEMGGAAGPIYASVLFGLADGLHANDRITTSSFADGAHQACVGVARRGRVEEGDGSLLDALVPFAQVLEEQRGCSPPDLDATLKAAAEAADAGARATIARPKLRGRASAHPSQGIGHEDPGARSLAIVVMALATATATDETGEPRHDDAQKEQR